jgi:hypothetical protein
MWITKSRCGAGFGKTSSCFDAPAVGLSPSFVNFATAAFGTKDLAADVEVAREAPAFFVLRAMMFVVWEEVLAMGLP